MRFLRAYRVTDGDGRADKALTFVFPKLKLALDSLFRLTVHGQIRVLRHVFELHVGPEKPSGLTRERWSTRTIQCDEDSVEQIKETRIVCAV